jgi:hypothetical protein
MLHVWRCDVTGERCADRCCAGSQGPSSTGRLTYCCCPIRGHCCAGCRGSQSRGTGAAPAGQGVRAAATVGGGAHTGSNSRSSHSRSRSRSRTAGGSCCCRGGARAGHRGVEWSRGERRGRQLSSRCQQEACEGFWPAPCGNRWWWWCCQRHPGGNHKPGRSGSCSSSGCCCTPAPAGGCFHSPQGSLTGWLSRLGV